MKLYAVKTPSGVILGDTTASSRAEAWTIAYRKHLYRQFGHVKDPRRSAWERGYVSVVVRVVEEVR